MPKAPRGELWRRGFLADKLFGFEVGPEFRRDVVLEPVDVRLDVLGFEGAGDRGVHDGMIEGKLKRSGAERDTVTFADLLDHSGSV